MKLIRLKITDPDGFRSLRFGFEHIFRSEWSLRDELSKQDGFAPFVCAGPNGSGKSNMLEVLAAIFYHIECIYLKDLPSSFTYDEQDNPKGFQGKNGTPDAFELEYLIRPKDALPTIGLNGYAHIQILKEVNKSPTWYLLNHEFQNDKVQLNIDHTLAHSLLPECVLGYSSGENEILSQPFFKMRFIQFDRYSAELKKQLLYLDRPETRMAYLDSSFSQAILLCNLLIQDKATLQAFREDVGIEALREFRIIIQRSITLEPERLDEFDLASGAERNARVNRIRAEYPSETQKEHTDRVRRDIIKKNPALSIEEGIDDIIRYRLNLMQLLEGDEKSSDVVSALKRCATLHYDDKVTNTLVLDYWVNDDTKQAFRENFDYATFKSPLGLFRAMQALLTLNLYAVSDAQKSALYKSTSHYMSETVPTLASDQRIMRFKFVRFSKARIDELIMLKNLSDGEHQLLHSLGLCLLFRETNSLFLLDEPETHFNPDWRANFISRLRQCFPKNSSSAQEMLITTHSPFLISDSERKKVLVFKKNKDKDEVGVSHPEYETLGASINLISMNTFEKRETIGKFAAEELAKLLENSELRDDPLMLAKRIMGTLGDSIERSLAIQEVLSRETLTQIGIGEN
jgi:restriction system-associated AAA family ATPase